MRTFAAFCAVFAVGFAKLEDSKLLWQSELDLVDLGTMDMTETFQDWKIAFDRNYWDEHTEYERFGIFVENLQHMARHNSANDDYKLAPNQFSDMTSDEFVEYIHGDGEKCFTGSEDIPFLNKWTKTDASNPASVDWDAEGKVTPVKDQGQCGSCWAFSATGAAECQYAIQKGTLNSLSEQELVDCSLTYGNLACSGGQMDAAFKYMEANDGLCTEAEYGYNAKRGSCKKSSCGTHYNKPAGYSDVTAKSESDLETAVAAGCVSVAIEADQTAFQSYSSGIITGTCGTGLDHGVLVVGYGTDSGTEYWKVKNSWSKTWGESGYVRICKNCNKNGDQGECGINDDASYPTF